MAAFSYKQHQPFLLDSTFLTNKHMCGFMEEGNMMFNTNYFPQFYPHEAVVNQTRPDHDQVSCLDHQSCSNKIAVSDNEASVTKKQSPEYSSTVLDNNKVESGDQVTQVVSPMERKRNSTSSNSSQSKGAREGKIKKQRVSNVCEKKEEEKKKNQKKVPEEPPTGYIHVRARRGQATDSHSLAERVRREKISERMKILQKLVPGCDKVTGKAQMLDEIINYVQSLQNQVEFLSMKLASVNPFFYEFGEDAFMIKPERLNNMESQLPSLQQQQCGSTQISTGYVDATTTTTTPMVTTTNNTLATATTYPPLMSSASLLLQGQRLSTDFTQDSSGNLLWDMEEQSLKLVNPNWFTTTNLCSFH